MVGEFDKSIHPGKVKLKGNHCLTGHQKAGKIYRMLYTKAIPTLYMLHTK